MTNVAFIIYRTWGYQIFEKIKAFENPRSFFSARIIITTPNCEFNHAIKHLDTQIFEVDGNNNEKIHEILTKQHIEIACFYGWSWIVREPILSDFLCLCLHPSPLPRYRGGTPLQHQIINGEKLSAVSVFRMAKGIDDGDIYRQQPLSLKGDIQDIFKRMVISGSKITKQFLVDHKNKTIRFTPQKALETNPPLKRRRPEDSVFSLEQLSKLPYKYVYNCVRALSSPYPNMRITVNGVGISVQKIQKCSRIPPNTVLLHENWTKLELKGQKKTPLYIRLKDGCAKLI